MKFQPGQSGNPAGRPAGSRNKKTIALEEAFAEHAEGILQDVIARAKDGESTAQRLCMERMLAPKRQRTVAIALPAIETPEDARTAVAVVTAELAEGNLTISEASGLISLIDRMVRLAERIEKMEQARRQEEEIQASMQRVREARAAQEQSEDEQAMDEAEATAQRIRERIAAMAAKERTREEAAKASQTGAPADPALYFPVNQDAEAPGASPGDLKPSEDTSAPLAAAA
jgi:hypothetical protein